MLQVPSIEQYRLSQSQIYEDLSQIIKDFKSLLIIIENIASNLHRLQNVASLLQEIRICLKKFQGFVKQYSYSIEQQSQHRNTFHRFICRLMESISAYKLKLQNSPYYTLLSIYIKQIEQIVLSYQNDRNIGLMIKKIHGVMIKFCSKSIQNFEYLTSKSQIQEEYQAAGHKKQSNISSYQYEHAQQKNKVFNLTISDIKQKKIVESKSENNLNKLMTLLNKKFKVLSCLQLEYQQFKQLFFRSRDSKEQLYQDCFQRNLSIQKEILLYSKQFSEYLQKKQLKIFRKNKFVDSLGLTSNNMKVKNRISLTKNDQNNEKNYNFMKKKNTGDAHKNTHHYPTINTDLYSQQTSPFFIARNNGNQESNNTNSLISIQSVEFSRVTPQLTQDRKKNVIFPSMPSPHPSFQQKQKFQQFNAQNIFQISKRKKNLQLKKIDISLTNYNNLVQNSKLKSKFLIVDTLKKPSVQTTKQMEQRINASIRKNFLQKRYENAMKKNMPEDVSSFQEKQKKQQQTNRKPSSINYIDIQQQGKQQRNLLKTGNQRKYLIKTSSKRSTNQNFQFKSLYCQNKSQQNTTVRNFKKLKMQQIQKIQKLQKMKQNSISQMEICSDGKRIKPVGFRQIAGTHNIYTQANELMEASMSEFEQTNYFER